MSGHSRTHESPNSNRMRALVLLVLITFGLSSVGLTARRSGQGR